MMNEMLEAQLKADNEEFEELIEDEEYDFDFDDFSELDELDIDEEENFDRDEFILSLQKDIANGYEARQILERLTN
jgi:hypothetical protein